MAKATILVVQGVDQGARFDLSDEPVGIGRGARNAVRILDTEVSRQHALIEASGGGYAIADRGSSNGTFVNGRAVRVQRLEDGDQIQLGRSVLLFHTVSENEEESAADRVDFVAPEARDDRTQIVGEVARDDRPGSSPGLPAAGEHLLLNLQVLYRLSDLAVSPSMSPEQVLQRILDMTIEVVDADRGCMLLADPETGEMVPQVLSRRRGIDANRKMPVSRSIVDYVLQTEQGVRTSDARHDRRFEPGQSILQAGIREAMCVPMQGRYDLRGVIYVDTTTLPETVALEQADRHKFSDEDLRLLVAIGRQSALAVENNRYQQALVKAERLAAMGHTIATLSHHIKNILQGVRGGSYLIDLGLNEHNEDLVRKGWGIVEKNQNRIYHLVMDMLTFSTERRPALESANLNETVGDVCELMQSRAEESGVKLEYRPAEDVPLTHFDPEGIHRAVLNIVTNAIDAADGRENPMVLVETGFDPKTELVFVAVTDNGPGIPDDQREHIFNAFESTKGARGTGLGLAVSRKIVREHGGEVSVESEPDQGCRFTLSWPRLDEELAAADPQTRSQEA